MAATLTSKCLAEFIGTFLLVFTIGCNVLGETAIWGGISIACVLMVSIYAFGGISGGNFNPAVSFALGLVQTFKGPGMPWKDVAIYWVVQLLGALTAGFAYVHLWKNTFTLGPSAGFSWVEAGLCEIAYTFMLVFVVLNVAVAKKYQEEPNQFYGLAIGFVIIAGAYGAGVVSGGCFNPAVAMAINVFSFDHGYAFGLWYAGFELLGAMLAVISFIVVRPKDFKEPISRKVSCFVAEFVGTFFLVLTVGLNVLGKSPAAAFSIAAALMSMIYAVGDISGAHLNPAVSTAIMTSGYNPDFTPELFAMYCFAQVLGGVAASMLYSEIHHWKTFGLGPLSIYGWAEVAMAEFIFTFVLCFVVLAVAVCDRTHQKDMFGFAIGACVIVGGYAVGSISGGSLNPAVSIGIHATGGDRAWKCLVYVVFEMLAGAAAAGMVRQTHKEEDEDGKAIV